MATPVELGYDLSVRRRRLSQQTRGPSVDDLYDIDICDESTGLVRTFRTVESGVFHAAGDAEIISRGTRVWKVNEVIDGTTGLSMYVLKDVWLDHRGTGWLLEGEAYDVISKFIDDHEDFKHCRRNFLSVETHGLVPNGDTDVLHHGVVPQEHYEGVGGTEDVTGPTYRRRVRYRVVFNEVGVSVAELKLDADAFTAISGAVQGELSSITILDGELGVSLF